MKPLFNSHMLLSEHFSLSEMLASETAETLHIPNTPLKCHITALQNLVQRCLEPTRQHFGLPIQVNSGYRCPQLNAAVKGASNSQHLAGEAADITIPRKHWPFCYTSSEQIARLLFTWMKDNVDLDQLILEHSGTSWWVHVSCRINFRRNRHQALKLRHLNLRSDEEQRFYQALS